MFKIILLMLMLFNITYALEKYKNDECLKYKPVIVNIFVKQYGLDYPWWFNLGQLKTESNCKWYMFSYDGLGSIGPAQIVEKFHNAKFKQHGLTNWKVLPSEYFYAYYILMQESLNSTNQLCYTGPTIQKKMWAWFQVYNTGPKGVVNSAITRARICDHTVAKQNCNGKNMCVYKTSNGCKQYRNSCDINFDYSGVIYKNGQKYKPQGNIISTWKFW
jgi:hypothetical protein